ncbi:TPA: HlyD family efflux transporter periplasmic adaptor subunit [Vibrio vulnificus]|uniref:HlyD family secretion protein n=1 Tax=Vibrio vulnificus TaxID=672 RepID=UPI001A3375EF|nr:HlyD family efflux transporter periplasmic adaptor subunit [Vibrio vulnificus]MCA4021583.1 HlyD family efflux transporter periplasmic adaptor subunit [Vibrio vulnificus]HAS6111279.1 HlyD family efflux transporter periplasmic adaptor subunit [Vibrio vulnificus]HDY7990670.1 HlyD family efflux transporter periplasmic adaptor subunit [Vibrio vulnificus]HDY8040220.1 HlyD family efflux transporter periplasmic adaptor subunit [Vibrio vulnificus]
MIFRKEAIEAKKNRLTGKIIIHQRLTSYPIYLFIFVLFLAVIIYLSQCSYSRKETVKGYLLPSKGVIKVVSGRKGILVRLLVQEGRRVERDQPLAKIRDSQGMTGGVDVSIALKNELQQQRQVLQSELGVQMVIFDKEERRIDTQLAQKNRSLKAIEKAKATSLLRLELKEQQYEKNKSLKNRGYLSSAELTVVHEEYLERLESYERLEKELASLLVEINALKSARALLPEQRFLKKTTIQRDISQLETQLIELENNYEFVITAPESGMVTAIQPSVGSYLTIDTIILSIIPQNSPLEMELLLPTRSAGFVQLGDEVRIRFDAFPYQKFGLVKGQVANIDQALVLPSDKVFPIKTTEAMYRVRAKLETQAIGAYGKQFPLKVGMIAEADIIQEKRSLLEWLLDPIYAIKGKLG